MDFNVDVVDYDSGEIRKEGMLLAAAHIWIAKRGGEIKEDVVDEFEVDDIDGGGTMEARYLYARFPETVREHKEWAKRMKSASEFWNYSAKEYVNKPLPD